MHVQQHPNCTISLDQLSFTEIIAPVAVPKFRLGNKQSVPTELRTAVGQHNWIATVSRPQISFKVYQASTRVKDLTVANMLHINKIITKVQREQSYLLCNKLDLSYLHVLVYTDASFNNLPDGGSQESHIVFLADASKSCCPITWTSNKAKRVVRSTLAAETLALMMVMIITQLSTFHSCFAVSYLMLSQTQDRCLYMPPVHH